MAGDWIKMRKSLLTDPRVVRISSALDADRFRTIGGLFSAWCLFDEQTSDGILDGYTPEVFDDIVGIRGLARAMEAVGWLQINADSLVATAFSQHNGQTAKRRAQESVRKMSARDADTKADKKRPREEKRREEKRTEEERREEEEKTRATAAPSHTRERPQYSPQFQEFFAAWPALRRKSKPDAWKAWQKAVRSADAAEILRATRLYAESPEGLSEFVRMPATWLRAEGWAEDVAAWQRGDKATTTTYQTTADRTKNVFASIREMTNADDSGQGARIGVSDVQPRSDG
jgi:flagellar biosynthesis GTPase FlhF